MNNINNFEEEDEIFWEPTLEEKRDLAKKNFKDKEKRRKEHSQPSELGPQIKKKFHSKDMIGVHPKTETQRHVFKEYRENPEKHFFMTGSAGTGKTFIGMYLGLQDVLDPTTPYEKLVIVRSNVESGSPLGFLPGDAEEKMAQFEHPYADICNELFEVSKSYENLKEIGKVIFSPTAFLRGRSLNDSVILVDEIQNMNFGELDTIITRVGYNSKIIFCGDYRQNDLLNKRNNQSGFYPFVDIISSLNNRFSIHEFGHEDIVRSGLVKDYIIRKETFFANEVEDHEKSLFNSKK